MNVFFADEQDEPLPADDLRHLAEVVMEAEGLAPDTEVTVLAVAEEQMADYNERFMSREGPTDVLAFPIEQLVPGHVPAPPVNGPPLNLGDVVVAPAYIKRQAAERRVAYEDELALMVTHGILHLLGYDHTEEAAADAMEAREAQLLQMVGRTRP
ncbi:MAG TPA: rRNA maturation RNase YbeY [Acidimicrobiia bacterium]|nr:rRNA maturation RNase YbeY [Acidimicrobiia bacterium]